MQLITVENNLISVIIAAYSRCEGLQEKLMLYYIKNRVDNRIQIKGKQLGIKR